MPLFGSKKKAYETEINELKQDVQALTQFSTDNFQTIDQNTYDLIRSNTLQSTQFNNDVLIDLWKEVPDISTVISKITDRAKNVPWKHFKVKNKESFAKLNSAFTMFSDGKESYKNIIKLQDEALEPIFDQSVAKLLTNPNDMQTWDEMIEQLISYYYVIGDAYTIKLGTIGFIPDELNVMASQQTDVIIKDSFLANPFQVNKTESAISHYEFDNGYGKTLTYDPDLIAHIKAPNLLYKQGAWRKGFSPLASAVLASRTLKHEYLSRLSLVRDRGMMGMIVGDGKGGNLPTPDETKALHERLKKFGLGDGKTNSYGATNGSYKWLNMSFNSGELELLTGQTENLKTLARKFNVPVDLLIGDSIYNNVNTAGKQIYTSNVMPWLNQYQVKINKLIGLTDRGQAIMPVYDNIPELQQDLKVQTEIMGSQYTQGIATLQEARIGVNRSPEAEDGGTFKDDNSQTNNIKE